MAHSHYQAAVLADNPVSYWPLDEQNGLAQDIVGGNHASAHGAGVSQGQPDPFGGNGAYGFAGTSYGVLIPHTEDLVLEEWTIEAWINGAPNHGGGGIFYGMNGWWNAGYELYYWGDEETIEGFFGTGNFQAVTGPSNAVPQGEWHHVAVTLDAATMKLFVDGVQVLSHNLPQDPRSLKDDQVPFSIGSEKDDSSFFSGLIDEVAIYDYALSAAQIAAHYAASTAAEETPTADTYAAEVEADSPVAWWRLGETVGAPLDYVGGNHADLMGQTNLRGQPDPFGGDGAIEFKNDSPGFRVPFAAVFGADEWTWEGWFRASNLTEGNLIMNMSGDLSRGVSLWRDSATEKVQVYCGNGGSYFWFDLPNGTSPGDDEWHHYAVTYDGATLRFYVDGQQVLQENTTIVPNDSGDLWFGSEGLDWGAIGAGADEIAFYDYALPAQRIAAHYQVVDGGPSLPEPPAAPTGLLATPGDGQVALDWDDNTEPDLDHYEVFRSTSSPVSTDGTPLASPTTSDYLDEAVQNGITYWYRVVAVDTFDQRSLPSSEVSGTPEAEEEEPEPEPEPEPSGPYEPGRPVVWQLNRIAGTTGLAAAGAANVIAGTRGLPLLGALNAAAGTRGLPLDEVCRRLAGLDRPVAAQLALAYVEGK